MYSASSFPLVFEIKRPRQPALKCEGSDIKAVDELSYIVKGLNLNCEVRRFISKSDKLLKLHKC